MKNIGTSIIKSASALFIVALCLQVGMTIFLASRPVQVSAAEKAIEYQPQIQIPNTIFAKSSVTVTGDMIAKYIQAFYTYGMSIVGILAAIVLMAGGVLWLTSGGDASKVSQAKELILGSIIGTVILFSSWIILNTVNPDLLKLKSIELANISEATYDFLSTAEQIQYVCLAGDLTCANTDPPSLNINLEACYQKFGQMTSLCGEGETRWCCGMNSDTQRNADAACASRTAGAPCNINETGGPESGYCANGKCMPCKYPATDCTADYECMSGSTLKCSTANTVATVGNSMLYPSYCNRGYCAGVNAAENKSCGPNNSGKCLSAPLYICPSGTSAVDGGTSCGSGLKCCK